MHTCDGRAYFLAIIGKRATWDMILPHTFDMPSESDSRNGNSEIAAHLVHDVVDIDVVCVEASY
jgi:hypothetical protein